MCRSFHSQLLMIDSYQSDQFDMDANKPSESRKARNPSKRHHTPLKTQIPFPFQHNLLSPELHFCLVVPFVISLSRPSPLQSYRRSVRIFSINSLVIATIGRLAVLRQAYRIIPMFRYKSPWLTSSRYSKERVLGWSCCLYRASLYMREFWCAVRCQDAAPPTPSHSAPRLSRVRGDGRAEHYRTSANIFHNLSANFC